MFTATLAHHFDAAHRLPHLGGKCRHLHGHTWKVRVTIGAGHITQAATIVDFADFKASMRAWIDGRLDHAAMLGVEDPLVAALQEQGCRVYVFGADYARFAWPTVEAVAALLADQAQGWLEEHPDRAHDAGIVRVDVAETPTNTATWVNPAAAVSAPTLLGGSS